MPLSHHITISAPATFTNDSAATTKQKLNDNFLLTKTNDQNIENRTEDALYDIFNSFILSGMTATLNPNSLNITVSAGRMLIGTGIAWVGGSVTCLASQTGASLYFCQDGTWATTEPTSKAYVEYCNYDSDGTEVTDVTILSNKIIFPAASISVTGDIVPSVDDTYKIGTETEAFSALYLADQVTGTIYAITVESGILTATSV